jgi:hypothetical protein
MPFGVVSTAQGNGEIVRTLLCKASLTDASETTDGMVRVGLGVPTKPRMDDCE